MKKQLELLKNLRIYLLLIIFGFVVFFLSSTGVFKGLLGGVQNFTVPMQIAFYQAGRSIGNTASAFLQIGGLRGKNASLEIENSVLKAENLRLENLEKENENLRKQLAVENKGLKIIATAHPVGKGIFGSRALMEINRGEKDGLQQGDLVIFENILLGQIISVSPHLSSVQQINDADTKIPVVTQGGAEGILTGEFGAGIELGEVVQSKTLTEGELVYTSGRGSFPRGLVIGEVERVKKVEKELFQGASVKPLVEMETLALVYIVSLD